MVQGSSNKMLDTNKAIPVKGAAIKDIPKPTNKTYPNINGLINLRYLKLM